MMLLLAAMLTLGAAAPGERLEVRFELEVAGKKLQLLDARQGADRSRPAVRTRDATFVLADPALRQTGWVAAAVRDGVVVAALDTVVEGPQWEVIVIASADAGRSWSLLSRVRKPSHQGVVESLEFANAKRGCLRITFEPGVDEVPGGGLLEACTTDGGWTWSPMKKASGVRR